MGFSLSHKQLSPIAIDFGVDRLKLLQVVLSDPPQMVAAAAIEIPEPARTDLSTRHTFLADALKQLLKSQKFKGRRAMCSIPAFQTLVQHFEISHSEDQPVDEQVGMQLRQRFNVDPARMVVRNLPVTQVVRNGQNRREVVCLAASRDAVMRYIETAQRAKLDVCGMHAEPMLILRSFMHLYRRENDHERTTCFIDLGAATTKVIIAHGQELIFAKNIHAAGDHFTRDRARLDQVDFMSARALRIADAKAHAQALALKHEQQYQQQQREAKANERRANRDPLTVGGVPLVAETAQPVPQPHPMAVTASATCTATAGPATRVAPQATPHTAAPMQSDTLDCIIDELHLCVRYHERMYPDRRIEKLVFLGGEAHHVGNCQRIAKALRIGAQLGDPLARLVRIGQSQMPTGVDVRQPQPAWAVPFGLCLSEPNMM